MKKLTFTATILGAFTVGCQAFATSPFALLAGPPQASSRANEAAERLRRATGEKPRVPKTSTSLSPREIPVKYEVLLKHFTIPEVLRMIAILESSNDSYELELKASELSGRIQAIEERLGVKIDHLETLEKSILLLESLRTEEAARNARELRGDLTKLQEAINGLKTEKKSLEQEQTVYETKAGRKAEELKKALMARLIMLRARAHRSGKKDNSIGGK